MATKGKAHVEFPVLDPLRERVFVQEVTYLAEDGRPITQRKMDYMNKVQETLVGLVAEGQGLEVVHVGSKKQ